MKNILAKRIKSKNIRNTARISGVILLIGGIILSGIGIWSFFSGFQNFAPPKYFWCAFIGFPMVGFGIMLLKIGFIGIAVDYVAEEITPGLSRAAGLIAKEITTAVGPTSLQSTEERLLKLEELKSKQLLSDLEYQKKKDQIINDI